jgi:2-polyprenyl-3-methyl-5-hydroxy-6-metoxy-1,4-benzoquinol methylase
MTTKHTKQQEETLTYFRRHAPEWNEAARGALDKDVNVIRQRNQYVLDVIGKRKSTQSMLDVGCGAGDLVYDAAQIGIRATGVDFAHEMIQIAKDKAKNNRIELTEFACCSIFDFDIKTAQYDVMSANGFIEYISFEQLMDFLAIAYRGLKEEGSLILGSRNRLFNLFSMNEFTSNEVKEGTVNKLLLESIAIIECSNLDELSSLEPASLPKTDEKQKHTGIDVFIRYQYTPVQLIKILKNKGFQPVHIAPIHIHGISPKLKNKYPSLHHHVSNLLQSYAMENMELIPFSSSFMLHAIKCR